MRETILNSLHWRYAVKRFDSAKKISAEDWAVLEESLRLAPSSYGLQPWKFLLVKNPEILAELRKASWNQSQVTDCSHFIVFLYRKIIDEAWVDAYMAHVAETRGVPLSSLDGHRNAIIGDVVKGPRAKVIEPWAQRQTYIAMGMLMESAALLGIDTCPMEGLDPAAYDQILKLEGSGWATVAACPVGYRSSEDKLQFAKKVRFPKHKVFEVRS
jgi:nitroreductase